MSKKEEVIDFKALEVAMASVNKMFGEGILKGGDTILKTDKQSSGIISLDLALGGGYGKGRIIEIYGPESAGKTMIAIYGAREAQKTQPNKKVLIIDAEHAIDKKFCQGVLGLDMSKVLITQPDNGEQGLEIAREMIKTGQISYCLIDSVSALVPQKELEGEVVDMQMALQARMMSKALRLLTPLVNQTKTIMVFINQLRSNIGGYGSAEITSGGNALKFFASQRIDVRKSTSEGGSEIRCRVVKNKLAPPFEEARFTNVYGLGVDYYQDLLSASVVLGYVQQAGSWFSVDGTQLGQGKEKSALMLADNPELVELLNAKIKETYE